MSFQKEFKIQAKLFLRFVGDLTDLSLFQFAKKQRSDIAFTYSKTLIQEIKPSETFENKVFNIALASNKINEYIIMPNQVFSFWRIVGNPNNGFKKSRSIVKGVLQEEIGGGLCQVSGILYHGAILTGIEVLERHNHSLDIYTDETRFTPLGTDATVVFAYKDLRLRNNYNFPLKFHMEVHGNQYQLTIQSIEKLPEKELVFHHELKENVKIVKVHDSENQKINESKYLQIH